MNKIAFLNITNKKKKKAKSIQDKNELFPYNLSAGNHSYIFDKKKAIDGSKYITINEIQKEDKTYLENSKIIIFEEYFSQFLECLKKTITSPLEKHKEYSIEHIREKYPKAYKKWTKLEDELLMISHNDGLEISELSIMFQRKPGAIRSRLRKFGVEL